MIYSESFVKYLEDNLGPPVRVTSKNIICRCPWCEYNKEKKHYHLYISTTSPIFHCFHATCNKSGIVKRLFEKIEGRDNTEKYVAKEAIERFKRSEVFTKKPKVEHTVIRPPLSTHIFPYKEQYLRKRFKFANVDVKQMKGLIFDIKAFVQLNNVPLVEPLDRIIDYLHTNFIGFMSEHGSVVSLRNVDDKASFSYYKMKVFEMDFLDYYKADGMDKASNLILLGEGIFDIMTEHIFDALNLKSKANLYACGFSGGSYANLIKSLTFYEQTFRWDVVILSDRDIPLKKYQQLKKYQGHPINSLTVYYNRSGNDFNVTPIIPEKFLV